MVDIPYIAGAMGTAAFGAAMCSIVPFVATKIMSSKRTAHKAWFAQGAIDYAQGGREGLAWARVLPRLIQDRAISQEDACTAMNLGVPGLPDTSALSALPTESGLDRRFRLNSDQSSAVAIVLAAIGLALGCALPLYNVATLLQTAILGGGILASCALLALIDVRCRMIPNVVVGALCLCGISLRLACSEGVELLPLALFAAALVGAMYATDAIYARLHSGSHIIGDGDKKVMAAIVFCSGIHGIAAAFFVLIASLLIAVLMQKGRTSKQAFGPFAALAIISGSTTSILM